jgi:hypothetical protein
LRHLFFRLADERLQSIGEVKVANTSIDTVSERTLELTVKALTNSECVGFRLS